MLFSTLDHADDPALIFEGQTLSRAQLASSITKVAHGLVGLGLETGDRVAIVARSCAGYVELLLGTVTAGGCAVPLPTTVSPDALVRMLEHSGASILAVDRSTRHLVEGLSPDLRGIALDFEEQGWIPLAQLTSGASMDLSIPDHGNPDAPFNIIYSSGTTGEPKGIVQSHGMRRFQVQRMGRLGFGGGAVTLVATPLCSNATLIALLPTLMGGGTVVLMPRFDERRLFQHAEAERVTHTLLVPVMYQRLLDHPDFANTDLETFQVKACTGGPFAPALKQRLLERWPGRLVEIYGLTEGGATTLLDAGAHPDKLGSVGRPAEGVEIRIVDSTGKELSVGETGEIAGRAPSMMSGYHKRPDLTEAISWHDERGQLYYRTGDLGCLDDDGFLTLKGRAKELIISGGLNIYPVDLERVMLEHPAVAEAAVIGVPSERWGESPLAVVVLGAQELCQWANERLGRAHRLTGVRFRDSLPRNELGKVLKDQLREL
jgi:acyl-CoA synthetase (AMP-forming)/AMP-acid ligase II